MGYLIKVLDDNNKAVDTVEFVDNLTLHNVPPYRNFNGQVGLTRCTSQQYYNQLVIMYFYKNNQDWSYAEFITEKDAYSICAQRNKLDVANRLNIDLTREVEVYD